MVHRGGNFFCTWCVCVCVYVRVGVLGVTVATCAVSPDAGQLHVPVP